jgi:hypothetical protein
MAPRRNGGKMQTIVAAAVVPSVRAVESCCCSPGARGRSCRAGAVADQTSPEGITSTLDQEERVAEEHESDDHAHDDHDHAHEDHEHEGPVISEEVMAEGAKLLEDSIQKLSPQEIDQILRSLPSPIATEVVKDLIGNKLDPRRLKNVGGLVVGPLRKRPAARLSAIVERLSVGILSTFEKQLGPDRFENPSLDDLREVIGAVLAEHPVAAVRVTLSWVVSDGLPAAEAARDLLLSDERLRLPDWAAAS